MSLRYTEGESIVAAVNKIDDDLDDSVLLVRSALCDEQGQRHQGVVGETLGAVSPIHAAHPGRYPSLFY